MMGGWLLLLYLVPIVALPILLISGLIRLRRFGLRCFDEYQRTRLDIGKIAEELSRIRQQLEKRGS